MRRIAEAIAEASNLCFHLLATTPHGDLSTAAAKALRRQMAALDALREIGGKNERIMVEESTVGRG